MQPDKLKLHIETAVSAYDIVDELYNGRQARLLYSAATHTAQSGLALDDTPELLFEYMERLMELVRALRPGRVLLLGGGAFILPRAILAEFPATELTVVELDDELPNIAHEHFGFAASPHTRVAVGDGVRFLTSDTGTYDLIIVDVYTDEVIPTSFQTAETAKALYQRLNPAGVVACNIISAYRGQRTAALNRQIASLQTVFSDLQLFPAGFDESEWLPQNFILTAQLQTRDLSPFLRYRQLPILNT